MEHRGVQARMRKGPSAPEPGAPTAEAHRKGSLRVMEEQEKQPQSVYPFRSGDQGAELHPRSSMQPSGLSFPSPYFQHPGTWAGGRDAQAQPAPLEAAEPGRAWSSPRPCPGELTERQPGSRSSWGSEPGPQEGG